jgi:AhpD family alkylhydroperoxidase
LARVSPASPEQVAALFGDTEVPLRVQIYAQRPELALKFLEFGTVLRENRLLPDRLIELVRLRVAFWNQCRSCMAVRYAEGLDDGVTEALVCSLERPSEAPDLSDAERAAIAYADLMATDHLSITDQTFDDLRVHFSEPEIVELCMNVALFVGFGRMGSALHMVDDLPTHFQGEGEERVTPWGSDEQVVIGSWSGS